MKKNTKYWMDKVHEATVAETKKTEDQAPRRSRACPCQFIELPVLQSRRGCLTTPRSSQRRRSSSSSRTTRTTTTDIHEKCEATVSQFHADAKRCAVFVFGLFCGVRLALADPVLGR